MARYERACRISRKPSRFPPSNLSDEQCEWCLVGGFLSVDKDFFGLRRAQEEEFKNKEPKNRKQANYM